MARSQRPINPSGDQHDLLWDAEICAPTVKHSTSSSNRGMVTGGGDNTSNNCYSPYNNQDICLGFQ